MLAAAQVVEYMLERILYWADIYDGGVAIPETVSSATATMWLIYVVGREDLALCGKEWS